MPRIKHTSTPEQFQKLHSEGLNEFKERGDCAVKAIAIACDVPYRTAYALCAKHGRKHGQGTYMHITERVVKELGYEMIRWGYNKRREMIAQYPGVHAGLKNITTHHPRRFRRVWAQHDGQVMMFLTARHILTVKHGQVIDWSVNKALQVQEIYTVRKISTDPIQKQLANELAK